MRNTVLSRISHWLKPGADAPGDLPLSRDPATLHALDDDATQTTADGHPVQVTTFLKPWAKRDAALAQLQDGFDTLNELVGSVRTALDRQAARQDELLAVLQHLPAALRAIPENQRVQTETLKAVGEQLQKHNLHYHRLADVLEKVSDASTDHRKRLDALGENVDTIARHDQSIADGMRSVSRAMETVSHNSHSSAQLLDQLRNHATARDADLHAILHRQGTRFTAMLGVAIALSTLAVAAVCVMGWKLMVR